MTRRRRARDYSLRTHLVERILTHISGDGWMARIAYRLGLQPPVTTVPVTVTLPSNISLPRPLRIAFASDFHAGPVTHPLTITHACAALADLAPDVLLLGGDYISLEAHYIHALADQLCRIPAPFGRYAVLGNHDLWADDHPIVCALQRAGIQVLINANAQLPPPFDALWICGLDDPTSGYPDAAQSFAGVQGVPIVVMHSPEGLQSIHERPFAIALCGHTHGGQVAWPTGKPIWVPPGKWNRRYPVGQFFLPGESTRQLVVSRGVGCGGLPVRCFAPADIVVCTVVAGE